MNVTKVVLLAAAVVALPACATVRPLPKGDGIARVNPASIALAPAEWEGRPVEMVGLLVWESENMGLYQSYGAYCRRGERTAIHADWSKWPGVSQADNRRRVMVRGTFRTAPGVPPAGGAVVIASGSPGPGPLEPGAIVRWLSAPMKPCPAALP
ncbi:MAG: hypothetical protein ACR2KH_05905 [Sphingomicrobium sp.]